MSQLSAVEKELSRAGVRLHRLLERTAEHEWNARPSPQSWSVAECVAHLNLTAQTLVPRLRAALEAHPAPRSGAGRYRRDPAGWLLSVATGPLPGIGGFRIGKVRTTPPFVPGADLPQPETVTEFDRWQEEQLALVRMAEGRDLETIRIQSPFDPRVRYNAYSCLVILARHQHRHLAQAERAARRVSGRA